jgi:hypothetical protein
MNLSVSELKRRLAVDPTASVRFVLPDGTAVPAHAHVTEVARIEKRFIDCGGTFRVEVACRLQTWVADDVDHRLNAGVLLRILGKAEPILGDDSLSVDVEHETTLISQYPIASVDTAPGELRIRLSLRHTECLAPDLCRPPAGPRSISFTARPPTRSIPLTSS